MLNWKHWWNIPEVVPIAVMKRGRVRPTANGYGTIRNSRASSEGSEGSDESEDRKSVQIGQSGVDLKQDREPSSTYPHKPYLIRIYGLVKYLLFLEELTCEQWIILLDSAAVNQVLRSTQSQGVTSAVLAELGPTFK